jgi:hypothetical protein
MIAPVVLAGPPRLRSQRERGIVSPIFHTNSRASDPSEARLSNSVCEVNFVARIRTCTVPKGIDPGQKHLSLPHDIGLCRDRCHGMHVFMQEA